jgi:hypothetical protein
MRIDERFDANLEPPWDVAEVGTGTVTRQPEPGVLRMTVGAGRIYSNAQIADYCSQDYRFRWRPPLRMTVTAWASAPAGELRGTAGFGFWNHPFSPDVRRFPRLPQAIWFFFAAPPSNMALAYGVPGFGWKAATIDATRPGALALAPLALPAVLLMRRPSLYATLWRRIQRRLNIGEHLLDGALLAEWHTYRIDWRRDGAAFAIDGATVYETPYAPRGAAGFVTWIDNQYAIVTPQGKLGFGIVPVEREQSLFVEHIVVEPI